MPEQIDLFQNDTRRGETVLVEGRHRIHEVELGHGCSCGGNECFHYNLVSDLLENGGRRHLSWVKSALHKEIRRGDFELACRWGTLWARVRKPGDVRQYVRRIWCEESRNVEGLQKAFATRGWRIPLYVLCCSPKDWQLGWDVGWASPDAMRAWGRADSVELDLSAFEGDDVDAALVAFWAMGGPDGHGTDYRGTEAWEQRNAILRQRANERYPGLAIGDIRRQNDEPSLWFAAAFGRFKPEEANFFEMPEESEAPDTLYIPRFADYVFDSHTWLGRKRLKSVTLDWEVPMSEGVDLRWSGDWSGTLWRYLAFRQFGTLDIPWERVRVDDDLREVFRLKCGRPGDEI